MRVLSTSTDLEAAVADALVRVTVRFRLFDLLIRISLCLNRKVPPNQVTESSLTLFKLGKFILLFFSQTFIYVHK